MDLRKAKEIHFLLFTFMGLLHEKIFLKFRQDGNCNSPLKKNHKKILNMLYLYDKLTITEIGKLLDIEKGSLTALIDFLEEKDFAMRLTDPSDRRKTLISLSYNGKAEMERIMNLFAQKMNEDLQKIELDQVQQFHSDLQYVVEFMRKL